MKQNTIDIITLGCSKNLVDSERLMKMLESKGYRCTHDAIRPVGEIAVINTCGFIGDAKEESINTILEFAKRKVDGRLRELYVMGCLSERYREELTNEIPEVDRFYGKFDFKQLAEDLPIVGETEQNERVSRDGSRVVTTPSHYAYIKIAEGCDRHCAYCAIPLITGKHRSRSQDDILSEVEELARHGVKEFQIIEQELTYYGVDLDGRRQIAELIDRMADINGVEWIRLHYAYPNQFPMDLLDVIRSRDNVCNYLDIALQHISDPVLDRMQRHVSKKETLALIDEIRTRVPDIHLRTTLMVGFPGETNEDFEELMDFVKSTRFEMMGAFAYSEEEGTYSALHYKDDIPSEVKQERLDRLMALQQKISTELLSKMVGQTMKVIIDRKEGDYYVGRTEYSSPEVDPEVLIPINERRLKIGHFYNVQMTDSSEFDLYGILTK
jgi:ribosomal protein S12 methylthiotransferase